MLLGSVEQLAQGVLVGILEVAYGLFTDIYELLSFIVVGIPYHLIDHRLPDVWKACRYLDEFLTGDYAYGTVGLALDGVGGIRVEEDLGFTRERALPEDAEAHALTGIEVFVNFAYAGARYHKLSYMLIKLSHYLLFWLVKTDLYPLQDVV